MRNRLSWCQPVFYSEDYKQPIDGNKLLQTWNDSKDNSVEEAEAAYQIINHLNFGGTINWSLFDILPSVSLPFIHEDAARLCV